MVSVDRRGHNDEAKLKYINENWNNKAAICSCLSCDAPLQAAYEQLKFYNLNACAAVGGGVGVDGAASGPTARALCGSARRTICDHGRMRKREKGELRLFWQVRISTVGIFSFVVSFYLLLPGCCSSCTICRHLRRWWLNFFNSSPQSARRADRRGCFTSVGSFALWEPNSAHM